MVLRSHTASALGLELLVAAIALALGVDALTKERWGMAAITLFVGLALAGGGILAFSRSTRTTPEGLVISGRHRRTIPWADIDGLELLAHRRGRREQIAARVHGELVSFPHPDAKSLALRPTLARAWYQTLMDRIESRRR